MSDLTAYIVVENIDGHNVFAETFEGGASRETAILDLLEGNYECPVRVVAFNTFEGNARDASIEIATEIINRAWRGETELSKALYIFAHRHGVVVPEASRR